MDKPVKPSKSKSEYQKEYRKMKPGWNIAFEKGEANIIIENATKAQLTPTEYIREAALRRKILVPPVNHKLTLEIKAEIRRIGINLNQITKSLNSLQASQNVAKAESQLESLIGEMRRLSSKL